MTSERITLVGEQETMLMTLYLHARDARAAHPVLGDSYAVALLDQIDYDFDRLSSLVGNQPVIVSRAKAIDDIARDFLSNHAEAVVLHLGCGLDSRVLRLDPGPGVTWFDIDQAPVIDLRRRLIPARPRTTMVATSVTETAWWSEIPDGRPTLIVGEGLLMYLADDGIAAVIDNALSRRAPTQTLVFDTVAPWVKRVSKWQNNFQRAETKFRSTTADLVNAVGRHPGTTLVQEESMVTLARRSTPGVLGAIVAAIDALPAGHRAMVLRTYRQRRSPV
jgi:O-methyltransferase